MSSGTLTEPSDLIEPGSTRLSPAGEDVMLAEERLLCKPGSRFSRVLMSFDIIFEGSSKPISPLQMRTQNFEGVEVVGAVGTLLGKAGMFAQACWFGGEDLDWMWVILSDIQGIQVWRDERFRRGEPCVWLSTARGDYAMTLPRREYIDHWEETIFKMGTGAADAAVEMWPRSGTRPYWWDKRWEKYWPFDEVSTAPTSDLPLSSMALEDAAPQPSSTAAQWTRLLSGGGHDSTALGYVPPSMYHQRSPWEIRFDGGLFKTHEPRGEKRKAE